MLTTIRFCFCFSHSSFMRILDYLQGGLRHLLLLLWMCPLLAHSYRTGHRIHVISTCNHLSSSSSSVAATAVWTGQRGHSTTAETHVVQLVLQPFHLCLVLPLALFQRIIQSSAKKTLKTKLH